MGALTKRRKSVESLIEIVQGAEHLEAWPSWALQVLATAGLSKCNRYHRGSGRGMLACDERDKEVGSGYKGPVRDSKACDEGCRMRQGRRCFGITAASALISNPNTNPITMGGGTVISSHSPNRNEIKELVGAEIAQLFYVIDTDDKDAKSYLDRYLERSQSPFRAEPLPVAVKYRDTITRFADVIARLRKPLTFDEAGILKALINSRRSHCKYHKIGCVAFNNEEVALEYGYNGPIIKDQHCCEVGCFKDTLFDDDCPGTCIGAHAEKNMILKLNNKTLLRDAIIFLSYSPCFECFKLLAHIGVKRVVYYGVYEQRDVASGVNVDELSDVMELANEKGIEVVRFA